MECSGVENKRVPHSTPFQKIAPLSGYVCGTYPLRLPASQCIFTA